jgi:hypothetical protein
MGRFPKKNTGPPRKGDEQLTGFAKGIVGIAAALIVVCGGLFLFGSVSEPREVPAFPEDRLGMVTAGDLAPYFNGMYVEPADERIVRKEGLFGVWELKYEFSVVSTGGGMAFVQSSQHILASEMRAEQVFNEMEVGLGVALRNGVGSDVHKEERNDILSWGEHSSYSLIISDGAAIGSLARVRKGKRVVMFMTIGVFLDDYIVADQIYGPILDRAFAYDPKTRTVEGDIGPIPTTMEQK